MNAIEIIGIGILLIGFFAFGYSKGFFAGMKAAEEKEEKRFDFEKK